MNLHLNEKNILLAVVISGLLVLIGTSFAYFVGYTKFGGEGADVSAKTADFVDVTYDAGTSALNLGSTAEGAYPGQSATKTFTVKIDPKDLGSVSVNYVIKLNITNNTFVYGSKYNSAGNGDKTKYEEIKWSLYNGTTSGGDAAATGYIPLGQTTKNISIKEITKTVSSSTTDSYTLKLEYLNIDDDQSHNYGKELSAKLVVEFADETP